MRKTLLSVLMALVMHATSAPAQTLAQAHLMNKVEFELFLHDLDRDTVRWINVASGVDVSSLKNLPYRKGELIEKTKQSLNKTLSALQTDISDLRKTVTPTNELVLLTNLVDSASSMADLASKLDIKNAADSHKYSSWLKNAIKALGEILKEYKQFYGHMLGVAQVIDRQINVGETH